MKTRIITALCFCGALFAGMMTACGNRQQTNGKEQVSSTSLPVQPDSVTQTTGGTPPSVSTDEQKFRTAFAAFQEAVKGNNEELVKKFIHFPLQTGKQWTNEDLRSAQIDKSAGNITASEFKEYYKNIIHAAVIRQLPRAAEDDLHEIDEKMNEDYYKTLQQGTDKDSKLYEVYQQYPEKNGSAESFYAFVFGRVEGEYKVVGYYAKWPVKG